MKTKQLRFLGMTLLLGLFSWQSVSAATGWFDDYLSLNTNGTVAQYTMSTAGGTDLNGIDLGAVGTLKITACDLKYWDNAAPGRTGGSIGYKIMASDNTTQVIAPVETAWTQTYLSGSDYQGILSNQNINLLTGLTVGTTYKLHFWAKSSNGVDADSYLSNGGNDYVVTFTYKPVTIYGANGITDGTGYNTLSAAFAAINGQGTQNLMDVLVKVNGSTTETATALLTQPTVSSWNSLKVYPTSSGLSVSGAHNAVMVYLLGADKITIDGSVGGNNNSKSLVIQHTGSKNAIAIGSDASDITIKNCELKGSAAAVGSGVVGVIAGTTTGNDNVTISNNNITGGAVRPFAGIYAIGTATAENDNLQIKDNNIYDVLKSLNGSAAISIDTRNPGVTITGNSIYETGVVTITPPATAFSNYGISIGTITGTPNGHTITGNYIGGTAPQCAAGTGSGTMSITATHATFTCQFIPIYVNTLSTTATSIQGNTIKAINYTGPVAGSNFYPIAIGSNSNGTFNVGTVTGNTIGATTGNGSITYTSNKTAGGDNFVGIYYSPKDALTSSLDCQNNTIGSITVNGPATVPTHFYGIRKTIAIYNSTIANNLIGSNSTAHSIDATSQCTGAATQLVYGILATGANATFTGNVIRNLTNRNNYSTSPYTASTGVTQGINSTATGVVNISNNTISDLTTYCNHKGTLGSTAIEGIYSAGTASPSTNATTIEGNTIFNLKALASDYQGYISGINNTTANTATTNSISKNFVYGMSAPTLSGVSAVGTGARIYGIELNSTGAANQVTAANNIVSLSSNVDNQIFGIYDYASVATATTKLYHNTIYLDGTVGGTALLTSTALQSGSNIGIRDYQNNVLVNARTLSSPATGLTYAIFYSTSGNSNLTADNNDYWIPSAGTARNYIAKYSTNTTITTIAALRTATAKDAASLSADPGLALAGGSLAANYIPSVPMASLVSLSNEDYTSVSIRTGNATPNLGAFEKLVPNAATAILAEAGNTKATVSFTAPSSEGSSAILGYTVIPYVGSVAGTPVVSVGTSTSIEVTGLTNGVAYTFRVVANSLIGYGQPSAASNEVTPSVGTSIVDANVKTNLDVRSINGNLQISGMKAGQVIDVYNLMGKKVISTVAKEGVNTLATNVKGIVIVRVGEKATKVIL